MPLKPPVTALENDVLRQQQIQIASHIHIIALISIFNAGAVSLVMWIFDPSWKPLVWFACLSIFPLIWLKIWLGHRHTSVPDKVSGHYMRRADISTIVLGALWGSASFVFEPGNMAVNMFIIIVQISMIAGLSSLIAPLPRITLRYAVFALSPMVVHSLIIGTWLFNTTALLSAVFMMALVVGGLHSYNQLVNIVATTRVARSAKQGLVDAIEGTRDAFVIYDKNGKQLTANASFRALFPNGQKDFDSKNDSLRQVRGRWLMQSSRATAQGGRVVVQTDVTTLKHRERELIAAQREAEDADQAKTRFISTMSHELRTPLNIILGFSQLMTEDSKIKLSEADVREYAENIHASGDHLLSLINDIIDYSKLGLDKYRLDRETVDLKTILVRAAFLATNHVGGVSASDVHISIAPGMGALQVDAVAFTRILVNLISNALKFRTEDPRVIVRAGIHSDGQPFIAVRDFGSGMTDEQLEHAFEAFYQGDPELNRKHGGTGLGLTLSRHLARLHDGDILLNSRPGVGTTAMLILPSDAHVPSTISKTDENQEAA